MVGESGSGKSFAAVSATSAAACWRRPAAEVTGGSVLLEGRDPVPLPEDERRKVRGAEIGMVYQDPMTSLRPGHAHRQAGRRRPPRARLVQGGRPRTGPRSPRRSRTAVLAAPRCGSISAPATGGSCAWRVLIACALAPRPKVLIADEPTTALGRHHPAADPGHRRARLRDEPRTALAVVWITHDYRGGRPHPADRVAVAHGRPRARGALPHPKPGPPNRSTSLASGARCGRCPLLLHRLEHPHSGPAPADRRRPRILLSSTCRPAARSRHAARSAPTAATAGRKSAPGESAGKRVRT
ncbi:ATP-binding cassette domain-containing protein [Yinghuangia aomiensis]